MLILAKGLGRFIGELYDLLASLGVCRSADPIAAARLTRAGKLSAPNAGTERLVKPRGCSDMV